MSMRKWTSVACVSALLIGASAGVRAQNNPFTDVDRMKMHWAYEAVDDLAKKKVLLGYPDGYFRGSRTLTRFEFAAAINRVLSSISTTTGVVGERGAAGTQGAQ